MLLPMILSGARISTGQIAPNVRVVNIPLHPSENDARNSNLNRYFRTPFQVILSRKQSPRLYHEKIDFIRAVSLVPHGFDQSTKLEIYSVFNSIVTILLSISYLKRPLQGAWIFWGKLNLRGR